MIAFTILGVLCCAARPAQADLISPIDPVIGVRGGGGSPDITDGSAKALEPCTDPVLVGNFCASYTNNTEGSITSLDLSFWDEDGLPIPTVIFNGETFEQNFFASEFSDFDDLLNVDLFTVRLCDSETSSACEAIIEIDSVFFVLLSIPVNESLFVFSDVDGFVSVRAVNQVANLNLPLNDQPLSVPEPGLALLFGLAGIAAVARRRLKGHVS
jgi:hypothetical protein